MKAIVGLGNPGAKYQGTRHNMGFAVVDELARRAGVRFESSPLDALIARVRETIVRDAVASGFPSADLRAGSRTDSLLVKPMTFMNVSGEAVGGVMRYFKIEPVDLLVLVDDVQLPLARLRARATGSAGGHNGLKSIIEHVGPDFARLRVGVGRGDARRDLADHVLARFDAEEAAEVERMTARAADAAEMFVTSGIEAVMNAFNGGDPATTE